MSTLTEASPREALIERRHRLQHLVDGIGAAPDLARLIAEVDDALERFDQGTHDVCVVCDESMPEELDRHPMGRYCLCDLTKQQVRALENDLETAWSIQVGLLPEQDVSVGGWTSHFRYLPAGPVSGDVVDLVAHPDDSLYFLLGDVAGKGVSAALLMAHLGAHFRRLAEEKLPIADTVRQLSDKLAERTGPARYVTLVAGVAWPDGRLQLASAGHLPALLTRCGAVERLDATGIPAGLFQGSDYGVHERTLAAGESIVLYTDGLVESTDPGGDEYGIPRLSCELEAWRSLAPDALAATVLSAAEAFRAGAPAGDGESVVLVAADLDQIEPDVAVSVRIVQHVHLAVAAIVGHIELAVLFGDHVDHHGNRRDAALGTHRHRPPHIRGQQAIGQLTLLSRHRPRGATNTEMAVPGGTGEDVLR